MAEGFAQICDASTGKIIHRLYEPFSNACFNSNGTLLMGGLDTVKIWNTISGNNIIQLGKMPSKINNISLSNDGKIVAALSAFNLKIWETNHWNLLNEYKTDTSEIKVKNKFYPSEKFLTGTFCSNNQIFATSSIKLYQPSEKYSSVKGEYYCNLYNTKTCQTIKKILAYKDWPISVIIYDKTNNSLILYNNRDTIKVYDIETGSLKYTLNYFFSNPFNKDLIIKLSTDNKYIGIIRVCL